MRLFAPIVTLIRTPDHAYSHRLSRVLVPLITLIRTPLRRTCPCLPERTLRPAFQRRQRVVLQRVLQIGAARARTPPNLARPREAYGRPWRLTICVWRETVACH